MIEIVARALAGSGIELVGSFAVRDWDARAPSELGSQTLLPGSRGAIVVGSAGPALFRRFVAEADRSIEHPFDAFVASQLDRVDVALRAHDVRHRRFEPTFLATPRLDFRALGELAGLGRLGPFGMLIHPLHGPWWALRGAWLVDAEVPSPSPIVSPCAACARPCVAREVDIGETTAAMRLRCPVGVASRYDDDAIAYHHAVKR